MFISCAPTCRYVQLSSRAHAAQGGRGLWGIQEAGLGCNGRERRLMKDAVGNAAGMLEMEACEPLTLCLACWWVRCD